MARLIEFYVPANFRPMQARLTFRQREGTFMGPVPGQRDRYVWLPNGALWPLQNTATVRLVYQRAQRG